MKRIVKRGLSCLALILIDSLLLIGDVIDVVYRLIWLIRYGFIKGVTAIIKAWKPKRIDMVNWDDRLSDIAMNDENDAKRFHDLRSK